MNGSENSNILKGVFVETGGVDLVTWRNPLEILKGRERGGNGTVDA